MAFFITVLFMHFNSLPVSKYKNKFTLLLRIWKQVSVTNMVHIPVKQNMPFAFFYDWASIQFHWVPNLVSLSFFHLPSLNPPFSHTLYSWKSVALLQFI